MARHVVAFPPPSDAGANLIAVSQHSALIRPRSIDRASLNPNAPMLSSSSSFVEKHFTKTFCGALVSSKGSTVDVDTSSMNAGGIHSARGDVEAVIPVVERLAVHIVLALVRSARGAPAIAAIYL